MTVILKKDDKVKTIVDLLPENYTFEDFLEKFKDLYTKDWTKLETTFANHEKKTKPGKKNPMPHPIQYLRNSLNVWLKKNNLK